MRCDNYNDINIKNTNNNNDNNIIVIVIETRIVSATSSVHCTRRQGDGGVRQHVRDGRWRGGVSSMGRRPRWIDRGVSVQIKTACPAPPRPATHVLSAVITGARTCWLPRSVVAPPPCRSPDASVVAFVAPPSSVATSHYPPHSYACA